MLRRLADIPALLVALGAGGAWYLAATRIMFRLGLHDAAPAIGALTGLAIVLTLWRRSSGDRLRADLGQLVCPHCRHALNTEHEHAGAAQPAGLQTWSCSNCGYTHAEALTCAACAR